MEEILKPIAIFLGLIFIMSCDKFLDAKPDQKMTIPSNLNDCDALLDNYSEMNTMYPVSGEAAADDYYLLDQNWESLYSPAQRAIYLWDANVDISSDEWQGPNKIILMANQVLEVLKTIDSTKDLDRYNRIKGSALFFRGYALSQLANVFTLPYQKETAKDMLGLPLRLSPNVDYVAQRASLEDTYKQIIADLNESALLLPAISLYKSRPIKPAAYAALARVGLVISDFDLAESAAKSSLSLYDELLDYNQQSLHVFPSFERANLEVLFDASTLPGELLYPLISKIDSSLLDLYQENDLRKLLYFMENEDGSFSFKGQYNGDIYSSIFSGIATDEVYLTLAEAYARNNKVDLAMLKLNELMVTRWKKDFFVPFSASNSEQAIQIILHERRKELVMRNIRWMDLRRLNQEPAFQKDLKRVIKGKAYTLGVDDKRYAFLIPLDVMGFAKLEQNER